MNEPSPNLKISLEREILQDRNIAIVGLQGVLDASNTQYLQETLISTIEESDIRYLVFDLSGLERVASSGIGGLMAVARKVEEQRGEIILTGMHDSIMTLFRLLGFTTFYKTARDVEHARSLLHPAADAAGEPARKFPLIFVCPRCGSKLRVSREGKFKCGSCSSIITVDTEGNPSL